jgi:hypothetical protein
MRYEKPNVVTLSVDELEQATMDAFLAAPIENPGEGGGGCACQCQCQCQCQGQAT